MKHHVIEENNTFAGIVTSKEDLIALLETALHFRLKWSFILKKKGFLKKEYKIIISGDQAQYLDHYFDSFMPASIKEITILKESY